MSTRPVGSGHAGGMLGPLREEDEERVVRRPRRNMRRLLPYFRPYRWRVLVTIALMLVVTATTLAAPAPGGPERTAAMGAAVDGVAFMLNVENRSSTPAVAGAGAGAAGGAVDAGPIDPMRSSKPSVGADGVAGGGDSTGAGVNRSSRLPA